MAIYELGEERRKTNLNALMEMGALGLRAQQIGGENAYYKGMGQYYGAEAKRIALQNALEEQARRNQMLALLAQQGGSGIPQPTGVAPQYAVPPMGQIPMQAPIQSPVGGGISPQTQQGLIMKSLTQNIDPITGGFSQTTSYGQDKSAEKTAEKKESAQRAASGIARLFTQYDRSLKELTARYPEIGKEGLEGWVTRKGGELDNYFDGLPETKAFRKRANMMAYEMVSELEKGRTTDQDRKVAADTFADALKTPTKANVRLASEQIIGLKDKGAGIEPLLGYLRQSKSPELQAIAAQVDDDPYNKYLALVGGE